MKSAQGIDRVGVVGFNHRLLPARQRGLLAVDEAWMARLVEELRGARAIEGLAFLSTCNRQEIVLTADHPGFALELVRSQLHSLLLSGGVQPPLPEPYRFTGADAVRHVLQVAGSLDSLVVGEREITQQMRRAFDASRRHGWLDKALNGLSRIAVETAKEVHLRTELGRSQVGVFTLAADLVRRETAPLPRPRVAVAGLGEIGLKTARELVGDHRLELLLASRSARTPAQLGTLLSGTPFVPLADLERLYASCDAIVVATGAALPVVRRDAVVAARRGAARPLVIVDIGIPPQVESMPEPEGPAPVRLFNLDWFAATGFGQRPQRLAALEAARAIVEQGVARMAEWAALRRYSALFDSCDALTERFKQQVVPGLLAGPLASLSPDQQRLVHDSMRDLLTDYADALFETLNRELHVHAERTDHHPRSDAAAPGHPRQ